MLLVIHFYLQNNSQYKNFYWLMVMKYSKKKLLIQKVLPIIIMENKFDLSQYQKDIELNLINKIIEEIFIFLTL